MDVSKHLDKSWKIQVTTKGLPFPVPLYEKYRPRRIADFIGLTKPKRILEAFIKTPYNSSWFFLGPSGTGKTTAAEALAEEIDAEVHQIPSGACDRDTIAGVTRMCHNAAFNFISGEAHKWHQVIVNEANGMTPSAQNWLLSKLDSSDPPPKTIFVFTANSKHGLEENFLSRTTVLEFTYDSLEDDLAAHLAKIYKKEGGKHPLDFEAIAKASKFNIRDALNKLQIELLLGTNRKDLPTEDLRIIPHHLHECEKCHRPWKHTELKCKLPHTAICQQCGGAQTIGSERARKAWKTIRANIKKELEKPKRKRTAA